MTLIKLGEAVQLDPRSLRSVDAFAGDVDLDIDGKMYKFAQQLKVIAPQAKDFLYFTCVMMHAAEAALLNDDGSLKKHADGRPVSAGWENTPNGGVKWICSDPGIRAYKNNNNDIFPELELKTAYKKWVGRPLCLDHKSDSVDKIRGVIVDTVWDDKRKRVIALCALDKKNYPDLADKVSSGVAANVSMGTAVGRAVCTEAGCHRVARTEKDFCAHMRSKTCYGEINLDLAPIELSLVVNGADPKAKVKHVIAQDLGKAAELLTDYLSLKESAKKVSTQDLASIKRDLAHLSDKLAQLENGDENDSGVVEVSKATRTPASVNIHSTEKTASEEDEIPPYASELQKAILRAHTKIASLQDNFNRLSSVSKSEEQNMSTKRAYYQGTVEPKPGDTMYQPDPLADKARLMDKHLHGPGAFPDVGDVEGMYPGITQDDKDLKKTLQRLADEEERAMFREAALKKAKEQLMKRHAYIQGTTEPNAGGVTYKPDPLADKAREEDKHLEGAPPFPGVGKVDGLYDDDLATKEKLSRAGLRARFEKVAFPDGRLNKAASRWEVYAGNKLVLAATVDQITKGNARHLYEAVATKRFGESLLSRIKTEGFQATANAMLKSAADPAPAADPAAPAPAPAAPPAGDAPGLEPPKDVDAAAPANVPDIAKDIQDLGDELVQKANDLVEASGSVDKDAKNLEGVPEAGADEFKAAEQGKPQKDAALQSMRKTVNGMLRDGIRETAGNLLSHAKELHTAREVYLTSYASMSPQQRQYLNALTVDAVQDARALLAETTKLMGAVIKYAYGTAELEKRAGANSQGALMSYAEDDENDAKKGKNPFAKKDEDDKKDDDEDSKKCKDDENDLSDSDINDLMKSLSDEDDCGYMDENDLVPQTANKPATPQPAIPPGQGKPAPGPAPTPVPAPAPAPQDEDDLFKFDDENDLFADDDADADDNDSVKLDVDDAGKIGISTAAGRAALRTKIAKDGLLGFNELSQQAHPRGSAEIPGKLDTKPSVESKFHVFKDLKEQMLDLAHMPPKVRKQAEEIQRLITAGQLKVADVGQLASFGVDQAAIAFWKELYGQGDSKSKEFAKELTSEHETQKRAEDARIYEARVKRAYDLAYEMRERGMIEGSQMKEQVDEIMKWNDDGFTSVKRMIGRQPVVKQASVPMVGLLHSGDVILPAAGAFSASGGNGDGDIKNYFDSYFANKKF
jgi:hypothetical protein